MAAVIPTVALAHPEFPGDADLNEVVQALAERAPRVSRRREAWLRAVAQEARNGAFFSGRVPVTFRTIGYLCAEVMGPAWTYLDFYDEHHADTSVLSQEDVDALGLCRVSLAAV